MENNAHILINPTATIQKSEMGHRENAASDCNLRLKAHRRNKRTRDDSIQMGKKKKKTGQVMSGDDEDDDDQHEELERKIVTLQRIVPGGETLGVDKLFEETADYILALQCQIKAMKFLTSFIEEGLEMQKKKKGKFGD